MLCMILQSSPSGSPLGFLPIFLVVAVAITILIVLGRSKRTVAQPQTASTGDDIERIMHRYTDAYRVGGVIVGAGTVVKTLGLIAGLVVLCIGALIGETNVSFRGAWVAGVLVGGSIWFLFWVFGVLISAQGQILKATIDGSVNNSPFLDNNQRARIMSLR